MTDFDVKDLVGKNRQQTARRVEWTKRLDFSELPDGTGLAAEETMAFMTLPAGYVHERCDPVLRTAEGEAATLDIGTEADPDGFVDGGNVNGNANEAVALAGTEALKAGTYFHTDTDVIIGPPAAAATVNVAVLDVTFVGYMIETA